MPTIKLNNENYRKLDNLRDSPMGKASFNKAITKLLEYYLENKR